MTAKKWSHLNRPVGYEIAELLIDTELSFSEIKDELPYTDINDNAINRILDGQVDGENVFIIPKTRGGTKYTLNQELFSEDDVVQIRERARARIEDNLQQTQSTESKDVNPTSHLDARNMESKFYR